MYDGMVVDRVDVALRSVGMAPVGTLHELPPLRSIAQIDGMLWRCEHQRAGVEHVRQRARVIFRARRDFCRGDMAGGADELPELPVRHRRSVNPKAVNGNAMDRGFFGVVSVRPHVECAAGYADHAVASAAGLSPDGRRLRYHIHRKAPEHRVYAFFGYSDHPRAFKALQARNIVRATLLP